MKDYDFKKAQKKFKETRYKILEIFDELIKLPETIEDEKSYLRTERILDLWQHDKMHLEAGGAKIDF